MVNQKPKTNLFKEYKTVLVYQINRKENSHTMVYRYDAGNYLKLLTEVQLPLDEEVKGFELYGETTKTDEEIDSTMPISDKHFGEGGNEEMMKMTNFNREVVYAVYALVENLFLTRRN